MNKEEQQQNLYKLLLQRNQINLQIIRKYKKKSSNYHKKITRASHICCSDVALSLGDYSAQNEQDNCQPIIHAIHTDSVIQISHHQQELGHRHKFYNRDARRDKQKCRQIQQEKEKNAVKLPSIVSNSNGHRYDNQSQVSISDCSQNAQKQKQRLKDRKEQKSISATNNDMQVEINTKKKLATELIDNCKLELPPSQENADWNLNDPLILPSHNPMFIQQRVLVLTGKLRQSHQTQNIRSTITQTSDQNQVAMGTSETNSRAKRQGRSSNSHKTLLNLHSIVFEHASNKTKPKLKQIAQDCKQYRYNSNRNNNIISNIQGFCNGNLGPMTGSKNKNKYKYKLKEQKERQKQNIGLIYDGRYHAANSNACSLNNIVNGDSKKMADMHNLANVLTGVHLNNQTSMQANSHTVASCSTQSISLTALSYLHSSITKNEQQKHDESIKRANANNEGTNNKNGQKVSQMLPQIRKLKQFRLNFHRLMRRQQSNPHSSTSNGNTACSQVNNVNPGYSSSIHSNNASTHNYSHSLSSINQACTSTEPILENEISRRVFRIQAIPVHQIKWI